MTHMFDADYASHPEGPVCTEARENIRSLSGNTRNKIDYAQEGNMIDREGEMHSSMRMQPIYEFDKTWRYTKSFFIKLIAITMMKASWMLNNDCILDPWMMLPE